MDLLHKSVFLIALASGLRISQLVALARSPAHTKFPIDGSSVILAPFPGFLAKNERSGDKVGPVEVPAWKLEGHNHILCPVATLKEYLSQVPLDSERLWVWPDSLKPCSISHLRKIICRVIAAADPGPKSNPHQVRAYAATLGYLRSFDTSKVQGLGQWASCQSLATRYLDVNLVDVPCVAMLVPPNE